MKRGLLFLFAAITLANAQVVPIRAALDSMGTGKASMGKGTLIGTYDMASKTLTYRIVVDGLQGTISAQHFHLQIAGGPVVQAIPAFVGGVASGTWTNIADSLLKYLLMEHIYVNVHTSYNTAGEIRGIVRANQFALQANLSAVAGVSSSGSGVAYLTFDSTNVGKLNFRVSFVGLGSTMTSAHLHVLPNGTVIYPLAFANGTSEGDWRGFPDSILTLLLRGKVYVNIHTSGSPGGEISGIFMPSGELVTAGTMDGSQAGTASTGKGTIYAVLSPNGSAISYQGTYNALQGSLTASHFHTSVNGGVVKGVTFGASNTVFGDWIAPTDVNIQDFLRGRLYFNVHSSVNAGGEIRAKMNFDDGTFTANLDSRQAGATSSALGTGWIRFVGDTVRFSSTWTNLSGTFSASHFHQSSNGSVIFPLTVANDHASGNWDPISEDHMTAIIKGGVYINVHTSAFPSGEIRGNFRLGSGASPTSVEHTAAIPASFVLEQNFPNPFNPTTLIRYQLPATGEMSLKVFDLLGRELATIAKGVKNAGVHETTFDASGFSSGVYLYQLTAGGSAIAIRKMILLR